MCCHGKNCHIAPISEQGFCWLFVLKREVFTNTVKLGDEPNERKQITKSVPLRIFFFSFLPWKEHMCSGKQILNISISLNVSDWLVGAYFQHTGKEGGVFAEVTGNESMFWLLCCRPFLAIFLLFTLRGPGRQHCRLVTYCVRGDVSLNFLQNFAVSMHGLSGDYLSASTTQ